MERDSESWPNMVPDRDSWAYRYGRFVSRVSTTIPRPLEDIIAVVLFIPIVVVVLAVYAAEVFVVWPLRYVWRLFTNRS